MRARMAFSCDRSKSKIGSATTVFGNFPIGSANRSLTFRAIALEVLVVLFLKPEVYVQGQANRLL